MSTTARKAWLSLLRSLGVKQFRSVSALGFPYMVYLGDFAGEAPYIAPRYSAKELAIMASWCADLPSPVILDVGANNGFIATQLAQMLRESKPRIFAFEPVPSTFALLNESVRALSLEERVFPICCALSERAGIHAINYNPRESLFAQLDNGHPNSRVGAAVAYCSAITVDEVVEGLQLTPALLKLDVEGFEPEVLRGANTLLRGPEAPAICLEWNPITLSEVGNSRSSLADLLSDRNCYYIDDFEGQRLPFGREVDCPANIDWVCNIFSIPRRLAAKGKAAIANAQRLPTQERHRLAR